MNSGKSSSSTTSRAATLTGLGAFAGFSAFFGAAGAFAFFGLPTFFSSTTVSFVSVSLILISPNQILHLFLITNQKSLMSGNTLLYVISVVKLVCEYFVFAFFSKIDLTPESVSSIVTSVVVVKNKTKTKTRNAGTQNMQFIVRDATISSARVRMLLSGATKSGKTFQALVIARELIDNLRKVGKLRGNGSILLICSEHGRAEMWYADVIKFKNLTLPDFSPETYIAALNYAASLDPSVIIMDQISHEWAGEGGLLEQHAERASQSNSKNTFIEWKTSTPIHEKFINSLNTCPTHLICTTRAVQDWVVESVANGNGGFSQVPKRIGVRPQQRKDAEYEFDIFGQIDQGHKLVLESRGRLSKKLSGKTWTPGPDVENAGEIALVGQVIAEWVSESIDSINPDRISVDQIDELKFLASQLNIGEKGWKRLCEDCKASDITAITPKQFIALRDKFMKDISSPSSKEKKKTNI